MNRNISGSKKDLDKIKKFCKDEGKKVAPFLIACALREIEHHKNNYVPVKRGFWK